MSAEEEATTTPPAEAEEPAAPAAIEETPTVEDTQANDAEEAPATADAGEDPEDGTAADREDVFAADDEATAELLAVGENLAGMTLADDLTGMTLTDEAPQPEPVKTPDVFDRMGYGSSEDGDGGERAAADVESDDDDRDLVAPLVDAIRRADSGDEPLSPSSIGAKAWALSYEISGFVATLDAPPGVDATIDELPPFIRDTVDALPTLARALALAPEPINTQRKIRIPAAGVHRVAVVEIIASLLEIGVADVDAAVAAAERGPRVVEPRARRRRRALHAHAGFTAAVRGDEGGVPRAAVADGGAVGAAAGRWMGDGGGRRGGHAGGGRRRRRQPRDSDREGGYRGDGVAARLKGLQRGFRVDHRDDDAGFGG